METNLTKCVNKLKAEKDPSKRISLIRKLSNWDCFTIGHEVFPEITDPSERKLIIDLAIEGKTENVIYFLCDVDVTKHQLNILAESVIEHRNLAKMLVDNLMFYKENGLAIRNIDYIRNNSELIEAMVKVTTKVKINKIIK